MTKIFEKTQGILTEFLRRQTDREALKSYSEARPENLRVLLSCGDRTLASGIVSATGAEKIFNAFEEDAAELRGQLKESLEEALEEIGEGG